MKYLKQFFLIIAIAFIGELIKFILPLPIPASIYGMVLLFVLLLSGIIKLDQIKETGKFLIEIMPVMFIPAGVGLMASYDVLKPILIPVIIITAVTSITVLASTGWVSQLIIRSSKNTSAGCPDRHDTKNNKSVPTDSKTEKEDRR